MLSVATMSLSRVVVVNWKTKRDDDEEEEEEEERNAGEQTFFRRFVAFRLRCVLVLLSLKINNLFLNNNKQS